MTYEIKTKEHTDFKGGDVLLISARVINNIAGIDLIISARYSMGQILYYQIITGELSGDMLPELEKAIRNKISEVPLPDISNLSFTQLGELKKIINSAEKLMINEVSVEVNKLYKTT